MEDSLQENLRRDVTVLPENGIQSPMQSPEKFTLNKTDNSVK